MDGPSQLSLAEIHKFMVKNNCKVTNHGLVKHFKRFLKDPATENEARKKFKTYVNILATVTTEQNQKYLQLREKYLFDCPSEDIVNRVSSVPSSPGNISVNSESLGSPFRQPPPYKPPPQFVQKETFENYHDCVNEFEAVVRHIDPNRMPILIEKSIVAPNEEPQQQRLSVDSGGGDGDGMEPIPPELPPRKHSSIDHNIQQLNTDDDHKSINENKENVDALMSFKEVRTKFNRMASEEEAKIIISPQSKKRQELEEMNSKLDNKIPEEVTISHPKAKEWIVAAAKANYQELAKLANDFPELVRLQDPTTTALHWAAKHGNEDICKMMAGTLKGDVNARTNGGYTPLHLAMEFGRKNIYELLFNVYKADRDITDWSGQKPLYYGKAQTSVSASTYSKIKARRKHTEKDSGFLRIGSLNVRVKKTTEAFSNFLGVGSGSGNSSNSNQAGNLHQQPAGMMMMTTPTSISLQRASVPQALSKTKQFDKIHKSWGSVDNIQKPKDLMPPPKIMSIKKRKSKRNNISSSSSSNNAMSETDNTINSGYNPSPTGYSSMPTTPNQIRAPVALTVSGNNSDSDTACGFDSTWNKQKNAPTYL